MSWCAVAATRTAPLGGGGMPTDGENLTRPLPVLRCDRDDAIDFSVRATERAAATAARTAACALCVAAAAASAAAFDAAETDALLSATGIVDSGASMRTGLDSSVAVA